jgi:hypothetical protein
MLRHYAHLAERTAGLALGAGLSLEALVALALRLQRSDTAEAARVAGGVASAVAPGGLPGARGSARPLPAGGTGSTRALAAGGTSSSRALAVGGTRLGRTLADGGRWIVRRSRPEIGYASLEVTLPWLASSVAGVNEAGLALAAGPGPDAGDPLPSDAAPAILLVQECLQRFSEVDSCLDWCLERPAAGRLSIFAADAEGEAACVELAGAARRVMRPSEGLLLAGGDARAEAELRKALRERGLDGLDALVGIAARSRAEGVASCVTLDPAARSLRLRGPLAGPTGEAVLSV